MNTSSLVRSMFQVRTGAGTPAREHRARKALTALVMAVGLAVGMLVGAAPAQASVAPNGATWYPTTTTCDHQLHQATRVLNVRPQPGLRSQYVATRTYVVNTRTGVSHGWTAWNTQVVYASDSTSPVGGAGTLPARELYRFYTQIMWWNGSRWTSSVGAWDNHYGVTPYGASPTRNCIT